MAQPASFMSYALVDDSDGRLQQFRAELEGEVWAHLGEQIPIRPRPEEITAGKGGEADLGPALSEVTLLIPILSPSFFNSPTCRNALTSFLQRETELERQDLILPVYYIECPLLYDEAARSGDELAQAVVARQWVDWRELRYEPFDSPRVGRAMTEVAVRIRDTLRGTPTIAAQVEPDSPDENDEVAVALPDTPRPTAIATTAHRVVDREGRGDYRTITDAIEAAQGGDRIVVRPGTYVEGLVIDKPLEIIGDGDRRQIRIEATGCDAILFVATMGRIANLTVRQLGEGDWYGVDIVQGRLDLEDCDIRSASRDCVAIRGGADPRLRRNRIHHGKAGGVYVYENGQGTIENNEILSCSFAGVAIREGGNPVLRGNRIYDGSSAGVHVSDRGQGVVEDNDIFRNAFHGVAIKTGGNLTLRRNRIRENKKSGVYVHDLGSGTLVDCDIFANRHAGVAITRGGNLEARENRINRNGREGVFVGSGGGGTIEDNDLRDNALGAWHRSIDDQPNLKRTHNKE
jgi:parallel beta-helix repeat protein